MSRKREDERMGWDIEELGVRNLVAGLVLTILAAKPRPEAFVYLPWILSIWVHTFISRVIAALSFRHRDSQLRRERQRVVTIEAKITEADGGTGERIMVTLKLRLRDDWTSEKKKNLKSCICEREKCFPRESESKRDCRRPLDTFQSLDSWSATDSNIEKEDKE